MFVATGDFVTLYQIRAYAKGPKLLSGYYEVVRSEDGFQQELHNQDWTSGNRSLPSRMTEAQTTDRIVCPHCSKTCDCPIGRVFDSRWSKVKCRHCKQPFEVLAKMTINYRVRK